MSGCDGACGLHCYVQRLMQRQPSLHQMLAQGLALYVLHCDVARAICHLNLVNVSDVRMVQTRRCTGFARKAIHPLQVIRDIRRENFYSDRAF